MQDFVLGVTSISRFGPMGRPTQKTRGTEVRSKHATFTHGLIAVILYMVQTDMVSPDSNRRAIRRMKEQTISSDTTAPDQSSPASPVREVSHVFVHENEPKVSTSWVVV